MSWSSGSFAHENPEPSEAAVQPGEAQPSPPRFLHPETVQGVRAVLTELSADPDALIAAAGLDPKLFDDSGKLVPFTALGQLVALEVERTHCPHLGLLVGQRATLASLGFVGLLMRSSETIGDALRALEAHVGIFNRGAVVRLGVYDDIALLSYAPYEPEAKGAALHAELALAAATSVLRALCGSDWAPLEVLLPRFAPPDTAPYGAFFRALVRFDQEVAALVFPAELLEQRNVGADPAVRRRVAERIRRLEAAQPYTLTDELLRYLHTVETRRHCMAKRVARLRQVNRRTLCRRLKAEGTSFRRLASEAQFRTAKQLLADTRMSMTQISAALDFSEPSAFTHAFRRWSGMTPSAWRQAN
jgi:AraC-like DNA-binding protein